MKCSEIKELIYTYPELTDTDKQLVGAHVSGCALCRALFASVQGTSKLIKRAAVFSPEPEHAAKLTGSIMRSINEQRKPYRQSDRLLDAPFLRYGMTVCSLLLIAVFAAQQRLPESPYKPVHRARSVLLNTSSMLREMREDVSRREESDSWYVCARQENCDLAIVQKIKNRNLQ